MIATDLLKNCYVFENFSVDELKILAGMFTEKVFKEGTAIFREGDSAHSMYVIRKGKVEVVREGKGGTRLVVASLGAGLHFGEMAYVDRSPRAATVLAVSECDLLEIRYEALAEFLNTRPAVAAKFYESIARTLCTRVRQTTSDLSHVFLP